MKIDRYLILELSEFFNDFPDLRTKVKDYEIFVSSKEFEKAEEAKEELINFKKYRQFSVK